jgi:crotonobetainyl-CoA:carnitine CoA-transferase CaiB-like acyl-CoA transferase
MLLEGLRVLDLSLWQPGHTATQLLTDLGADVIKVEPPGGDRMRQMADRFVHFNGGKRSIALDLKNDDDRAVLFALVARSEVLVENFRPGVAERLGVGFESLRAQNPSIVMCSISGFGQTGPLARATGHDHNYQAWAGAFTMRDNAEPVASGMIVADQGSGLAAAFAILAGVLCARRTGVGEHIDVSMTDLIASWVAPMGPLDARREPERRSHRAAGLGTYQTNDGRWVVLGVFSEDHFWDELCRGLGLDQHVGLTLVQRTDRADELDGELRAAIGRCASNDLVNTLAARSVPISPVLTREEMLDHPHFTERGTITIGPDGYRAVGHPIRYRVHPTRPLGRPPAVDEHHGEIVGLLSSEPD